MLDYPTVTSGDIGDECCNSLGQSRFYLGWVYLVLHALVFHFGQFSTLLNPSRSYGPPPYLTTHT